MSKEITQSSTIDSYQSSDSTVTDYIILLKPRVMSLVVFSGLIGLLISPGQIHPLIAFCSILCISIGSGAAGAINMWYDRDIDKIMYRTMNRPIPSGRIAPDNAFYFGTFLAIFAVMLMGLTVNITAASILALAILFYIFVYTIWLKRRTKLNIVIGGAAGSFPPMIGWLSVNDRITIEPMLLFMIIFIWTVPHFWALSLYKSQDYERAKIPMLPVVSGNLETKKQILLYSLLLFPVAVAPFFVKMLGLIYFSVTSLLTGYFIYIAYKLYKHKDITYAPKLFSYSINYLFIVFLTMLVDNFVGRF